MLVTIVQQVAALAERCEVGIHVVRRIVVPVSRRQHDPGRADATEEILAHQPPAQTAPPTVTPAFEVRVEPPPIPEVMNAPKVRAPAALAPPARAPEADHSRQLAPVNRVEVAVLRSDWHPGSTM
jgi:hypothetical protein